MNCTTLDVNIMNKASSQYKGYNFNSFATFNGKDLGANSEGLFELTGDTDNGKQINAEFQPVVTDFGSHNNKRIRRVHMGLCCSGAMEVSLTADNQDPNFITLETTKGFRQSVQKTAGRRGKGRKGRYWGVRVANVGGCDFSVYSIELLINKLHSGNV